MSGKDSFLNNMMPNFLTQLIYKFQQNNMMVGTGGRDHNHFYDRADQSNHNFKSNQRKERALSR